jgi:hypothetical protein
MALLHTYCVGGFRLSARCPNYDQRRVTYSYSDDSTS